MLHRSFIPVFHPDESPASACSRVAIVVGRTARDFCLDMGISFSGIVEGRAGDLARLANACRLDNLPGVAVTGSGHLFHIAGETFTRDTLSRMRLRVCPRCIAEDLRTGTGPVEARPYGRTVWLVEAVRTCSRHGCALVVATDDGTPSTIHDFARLISPFVTNLEGLESSVEDRSLSSLELHVLARLSGKPSEGGWLSAFPAYAACKISETIGAVYKFGPRFRSDELSDRDWHGVGGNGFDIADGGEASISVLLSQLQSVFLETRHAWGPKQMFGRLYEWVAHETSDPVYEPLRTIVRDHMARTMPLGPGAKNFSVFVEGRTLHSVRTAARESGLHPKRLRKLLHAAGIIDSSALGLSDDRIMFPAEEAAPFLAAAKGNMTLKAAGAYLNAPRPHERILLEAGFLRPVVGGGVGKPTAHMFARSDIDDLLERLRACACPVGLSDGELFQIPAAAKRANCSAAEIVGLLLDRKLKTVRLHPTERGYLSVLVDVGEIMPLVRRQDHGGVSLREVSKRMGTRDAVVKALVDHGHLPARRALNPINRCPQTVVDQVDIDSFAARYVSLSHIARGAGLPMIGLKARLAAGGASPAFDAEAVPAAFYERKQVEGVDLARR